MTDTAAPSTPRVEKSIDEQLEAALAKLNKTAPVAEVSALDEYKKTEVARVKSIVAEVNGQLDLVVTEGNKELIVKVITGLNRVADNAAKSIRALTEDDVDLDD